jgi:spore coat protein YutH
VTVLFERNIFDEYKLYCEQRFILGDYEGFTAQNKHYFLVAVDEIEDNEITEMIKMGNHLTAVGDHEIATFVPTVNQALTSFVEGQNRVLFELPMYVSRTKKQKALGFELARHHQRGKNYPPSQRNSGAWSQYWINRLTQLEKLYVDLSKNKQKLSFDQAFMVSFPYYLGRTENAIQYIVDSNLDYRQHLQMEPKTICHYQFSANSWLTIDDRSGAAVKSPIDFLYDYPSRDVAEWIRQLLNQEDDPYRMTTEFVREYESVQPISPLGWRYIYGRLLFPIDYFKIIEGYYRSVNDEDGDHFTDKLFELFQQEVKTEVFLSEFHHKILPTHQQASVPVVDWLVSAKTMTRNNNPYFLRRQ